MRLASFVALIFLSLGGAGYAIAVYGFLPIGALVHPDMRATFEMHRAGIYAHVFASAVALALGPFQFSATMVASVRGIWHSVPTYLSRDCMAVLGAQPFGRRTSVQPVA